MRNIELNGASAELLPELLEDEMLEEDEFEGLDEDLFSSDADLELDDEELDEERRRLRRLVRRRPRPSRVPKRPRRLRPRGVVRPGFRRKVIVRRSEPCICPVHGSEYIRWVQSALNQIMKQNLVITGVMNRATREALRNFQKREELPSDGIPGPETKKALVAAKSQLTGLAEHSSITSEDTGMQPESFEFMSDALEAGHDEFELEFENPRLSGGILEKDYLRWVQGSLNMYFEKTGLHAPITADGKDTVAFRDAVELFNKKVTGRSKLRQLDRRTQDALVRENARNSKYLTWLRTTLNKFGWEHLTSAYGVHENPTAAIKEFQRDHDGKFGLTLKQDGWVGAKTHMALLHAIMSLEKKPPSTSKDKPVPGPGTLFRKYIPQIIELLKVKKKVRVVCWLSMLMRSRVDDRYITELTSKKHLKDDLKVPIRHYTERAGEEVYQMMKLYEKHYLETKGIDWLFERIMEIDRGIYNGFVDIATRDGMLNTEGMVSYPNMRRMYDFVRVLQADPESIYSCFVEPRLEKRGDMKPFFR